MHLDQSWIKKRMKTLMRISNKIMKTYIERQFKRSSLLNKFFELIVKKSTWIQIYHSYKLFLSMRNGIINATIF